MLLTLDKLLEAARESRQRPRSAAELRLAPSVLAALAEGEPVTPERVQSLGREAGLAGVELATAIAGIRDSSSLGADGSVRAFMGLSLDPTPHRFVVEGRTLYTWCALDTTFLPVLLGKSAEVESASPVSGAAIRVSLGPDGRGDATPSSAVISVVLPSNGWSGKSVTEMRRTFCEFSHWFSSAAEAQAWIPAGRQASVVPAAEAAALGRAWAELVSDFH